jgi:hypothetical protein
LWPLETRVSCVVCAGSGGLDRRSLSGGGPVCSGQRERREHAPCERVVAALQGAVGTSRPTVNGLVSAPPCCCSAATAGCCRVSLPGCPWARCRSIAIDASHPSLSPSACRCCSYCLCPPPALRTPSLVRDRAPSTLHRTARPLSQRATNACSQERTLVAPQNSSTLALPVQFPPAPPVRSTRPLLISSAGLPHVRRQSA